MRRLFPVMLHLRNKVPLTHRVGSKVESGDGVRTVMCISPRGTIFKLCIL